MSDDRGSQTSRPVAGQDPRQPDAPSGRSITLGRWAGVPVRAHWSVLFTLALFTFLIAGVDLPVARPGLSTAAYWVTGALTALVFLSTVLAHEFAHTMTARHSALRVRRITLWMFGGVTEFEGEPPTPRADAVIAASGPLTSLALGAGFASLSSLLGAGGVVSTALAWLAGINVLLGLFNLLPAAPLDGGRILRALIWWRTEDRARAAAQAARVGRALGLVLIVFGLLGSFVGNYVGLWAALVGWIILNGAAGERYSARAETLHGLTARDAMTPTQVVPDWWTVEHFVSDLAPGAARQPVFPLVDLNGTFSGVVALSTLGRVPAGRRASTRMRELAAPVTRLFTAAPGDGLPQLLLPLHLHGGIAVVVDERRPIGLITDADLARAAELAGAAGRGH